MKRLLVSLVVIFTLTACAGGTTASVEGQWTLVSYNGIAAVPDVETSIEFKDGQMSGNVGCNGFGGEYSVDGSTITFGPVETTLMFCEGPVGDQEMITFAVFRESAALVVDGNVMTIISADGNSSIMLEKK